MRYRLMATFGGAPFEAGIGPTDGDIVLFAACPPPEELGFEPATGHWRRQLPISGVQAVWESRPIGMFGGERCMVLDELGDRLHIGYMGHDGYRAEQLGYWQVDRGVYELIASRSEVTEIAEERPEYPRRRLGTGVGAAADQVAGPGFSGTTGYGWPEDGDTGQYAVAAGFAHPPASADRGGQRRGYEAGRDTDHGITLPPAAQAPLPLEAAALAAATASRRPRQASGKPAAAAAPTPDADRAPAAAPAAAPTAPGDTPTVADTTAAAPPPALAPIPAVAPAPVPPAAPVMAGTGALAAAQDLAPAALSARSGVMAPEAPPLRAPAPARVVPTAPAMPGPAAPGLSPSAPAEQSGQADPGVPASGQTAAGPQGRSARRAMATERLFTELAGLAGISVGSYAIGEEVEGAFCLVQTQDGFEVFHYSAGNRHELQFFRTEEAACFYLFGLLAADAVRAGSLGPTGRQPPPARAAR